jgi:DNA-binding transcriptional ArsR family regulator
VATTPADQRPDPGTERIDALERAVAGLVQRVDELSGAGSAEPGGAAPGRSEPEPLALPEQFWALNALRERYPAPGAVVFAGGVDLPIGHVDYQWGRETPDLLQTDWAERAERVAALGHPLRLSLLRLLLDGEHTVAQLVDELELASTGVAYHHLNQLQSAGWATSPHRGVWSVPATRVIPLLVIITALEEA